MAHLAHTSFKQERIGTNMMNNWGTNGHLIKQLTTFIYAQIFLYSHIFFNYLLIDATSYFDMNNNIGDEVIRLLDKANKSRVLKQIFFF